MKKLIKIICCLTMMLCLGCQSKSALDKENPVTVKLWHYYSGKQLESFNDLVEEFNTTVGKEKGIIVDATSFGTVNELGQRVIDAAEKKVGAKEIPDIFAAYADTAYQVDALDLVADLKPYFSKSELSEYIDGYIEEGYFHNDDELKIFPTAKSTEVMMINKTDFDKFAKATGVSIKDLSTIEGLTAVSQKYYEYTDSLTATPNDGKALFGRDAIANYMIIGLKQFGHDILTVEDGKVILDFDKETVKKLWDNYYVPYISGYFSSKGRFRSDDVKIGNIMSCVCSSSGATFFPTQVILNDTQTYDIEVEALKVPLFKGGKDYAVQQGAGMVVIKNDDAHQEGSVEFIKWFTQKEKNIKFSVDSGYLPVTKEANDFDIINQTTTVKSEVVKDVIEVSVDTVNNSELYVPKSFNNGTAFRNELESSMQKQAETDRQAVISLLNQGTTLEKAISSYTTNDYFEQWYQKTYQALLDIVG